MTTGVARLVPRQWVSTGLARVSAMGMSEFWSG